MVRKDNQKEVYILFFQVFHPKEFPFPVVVVKGPGCSLALIGPAWAMMPWLAMSGPHAHHDTRNRSRPSESPALKGKWSVPTRGGGLNLRTGKRQLSTRPSYCSFSTEHLRLYSEANQSEMTHPRIQRETDSEMPLRRYLHEIYYPDWSHSIWPREHPVSKGLCLFGVFLTNWNKVYKN